MKEELSSLTEPKLAIIIGPNTIDNENELVELCREIGFKVRLLKSESRTELAEIYRVLNSTDAVLDVSGRFTLAHLLFTRHGGVFIQVLCHADKFNDLAKKIGLEYVTYEDNCSKNGTLKEKKSKTIRLDLNSVLPRLTRAYQSIVGSKMEENDSSLRWNQNWTARRSET